MRQFIKGAILLLTVLVCSQGIANETVQVKTIWKIFEIDDKRAFLICDDYEVWLLHGLQPNRLTWNEWIWREEVPQPDASYFFDVKKWEEGKTVSIVYSPWHDCEWKDIYRNNTSLLQNCHYVIKNNADNAYVFAKLLPRDEWKSFCFLLIEEARELRRLLYFAQAAKVLQSSEAFYDFQRENLNRIEK